MVVTTTLDFYAIIPLHYRVANQCMYQLAIKDPVYGLSVWNAEVFDASALTDIIKQIRKVMAPWCSLTTEARIKHVQTWQQQCQSQLTELCKVGSQTTGLPSAQLTSDLMAWVKMPLQSKDSKPGVIALLADTVDIQFLHLLTEHLLTGWGIVLAVPGFLAALMQQLLQCWPHAETAKLLAMLVVNEWADLDFNHSDIDALYYWGSSTGAKIVHAKLAGQFDLQSQFNVFCYHTIVIAGEVTEDQINKLVRIAFHHSGQSLKNVKRIIVTKEVASQVRKLLVKAAKQLRVAAFDAQPEPFISSLPTLGHAKQALTYYQEMANQCDNELIPMRHLISKSGMLTPGIIELSPDQVNLTADIVPAPLLQLVVVDDLMQAAGVIKHTRSLGTVQVLSHNDVAMHKLKLICRGIALTNFK